MEETNTVTIAPLAALRSRTRLTLLAPRLTRSNRTRANTSSTPASSESCAEAPAVPSLVARAAQLPPSTSCWDVTRPLTVDHWERFPDSKSSVKMSPVCTLEVLLNPEELPAASFATSL